MARPDPVAEGAAVVAALLAAVPLRAAGAVVDAGVPAGPGGGDGGQDGWLLVTATVGGLAAAAAAVGLPAGRGEELLADRAAGRPAVVPRRAGTACWPVLGG